MFIKVRSYICVIFCLFLSSLSSSLYGAIFKLPGEGSQVVYNRLFPKEKKIEVNAFNSGMVINQSLINSYLVGGSVSYFWSEISGVNLEFLKSFNYDSFDRECLERFYDNIFGTILSTPCATGDSKEELEAGLRSEEFESGIIPGTSIAPTYMGVREIDMIITASYSWNPLYGKQLAFLSFTSYFDFYINVGGGVTISDYYPQTLTLKNGRLARKAQNSEQLSQDVILGCPSDYLLEEEQFGVCPSDPNFENYVGKNGRPDPERQITPTLTFTLGQKFHFSKRFFLKAELKDHSLFSDNGVENFISVYLGAGFKF